MPEGTAPALLFFERQRLSRFWLLVPIVPLAVIAALVIAIGGLLAALRLDIEVGGDVLHVRMRPFVRRTLSLDEIASFEARSYRPICEYGGWGIRWGPSGRAYNLRGNRGVQLTLADGGRLLLGSQRADELAAAIEEAATG